tara:strand:- start:6787 stop:8280 length:1494 start_codon:yes stop_codon:yes gene_type:complete
MKVLSLFDGMSCGRIALDQLGIPVEKYYASEIDKYAMQVSAANYPDIEQVGDICNLDPKDYKDVDLMLAGSPCQGFSFAGKQLAFDDPRSALFFEFIRLLKAIKPKYFLLENVRMKKEFLEIITQQVSDCYEADDVAPEFKDILDNVMINPHFINSSLLSAQSRQRYYWTNIPGIKQPEDRGIVLRDILETETDERPVKDTERNQRHYKNEDEKSLCMTATMYKGAGNNGMTLVPQKPINKEQMIETMTTKEGKSFCLTAQYDAARPNRSRDRKEKTMIPVDDMNNLPEGTRYVYDENDKSHKIETKPKQVGVAVDINGHDILKRVYSPDGKSPTVNTCQGGNREPKVAVQSYREVRTDEAKAMRKMVRQQTGKDHTPFRAKKLEPRKDGKVGTVTPSLNKDHEISIKNLPDKSQTIKSQYYKSSRANFERQGTFHATGVQQEDLTWRKLTPLECERLQTVPDNYTDHVSNTQRYKMLGNGWTVEVIKHIFQNMEIE